MTTNTRPANRFGHAFASGDIDDDGFDDLAVGGPGEDDDAGVVYVFLVVGRPGENGYGCALGFTG